MDDYSRHVNGDVHKANLRGLANIFKRIQNTFEEIRKTQEAKLPLIKYKDDKIIIFNNHRINWKKRYFTKIIVNRDIILKLNKNRIGYYREEKKSNIHKIPEIVNKLRTKVEVPALTLSIHEEYKLLCIKRTRSRREY
jgi:hypothetical protein